MEKVGMECEELGLQILSAPWKDQYRIGMSAGFVPRLTVSGLGRSIVPAFGQAMYQTNITNFNTGSFSPFSFQLDLFTARIALRNRK